MLCFLVVVASGVYVAGKVYGYQSAFITTRVAVRALLGFTQMTVLIQSAYSVPLPKAYLRFLRDWRILTLDLGFSIVLQCLGGGYGAVLYLVIAAPIVVLVGSVLWNSAIAAARCTRGGWQWRTVARPALVLSYVLLPGATTVIFTAWNYDPLDVFDKNVPPKVLRGALSQDYCDSAHQNWHLPVAAAGAVLYAVVIPVALFFALRVDDSPLKLLSAGYQQQFRLWEISEALRQLLLGGISVIAGIRVREWLAGSGFASCSNDNDNRNVPGLGVTLPDAVYITSTLQLTSAILVQAFFAGIVLRVQPLESHTDHAVQVLAHTALAVMQLSALVPFATGYGADPAADEPMGNIMAAVTVLVIFGGVFAIIPAVVAERARTVLRCRRSLRRVHAVPLSDGVEHHCFISRALPRETCAVRGLNGCLTLIPPRACRCLAIRPGPGAHPSRAPPVHAPG